MMNWRSGTVGWCLLTALVVGWDYYAARNGGETLSAAYRRGLKHPGARFPVVVAWTVTTAHIFGGLKPRYDPFIWAGRAILRPKST